MVAGAGGGGPPKPKPPQLTPPKLGQYNHLSSYSNAECLDVLCEGPIDGICNKLGIVVEGSDILQGVYLNGVAVQETRTLT